RSALSIARSLPSNRTTPLRSTTRCVLRTTTKQCVLAAEPVRDVPPSRDRFPTAACVRWSPGQYCRPWLGLQVCCFSNDNSGPSHFCFQEELFSETLHGAGKGRFRLWSTGTS